MNKAPNNFTESSTGKIDPFVTIGEFARELKVCIKTIYRRIDAGDLPRPSKIGRCSRFPRSVVTEYKRKIGSESV